MAYTIQQVKTNLKRRYKTDHRIMKQIEGTPYKIAIPYSVSEPHGYSQKEFCIGSVRFLLDRGFLKALDPVPASWFVDLSLDVVQEVTA